MAIYDLTVNQLKRAAAIKEQIEQLNKELRAILGTAGNSRVTSKKSRGGMSAATKKKIAAAQKARWAKIRRAKPAARSGKPAGKNNTGA